MEEKKEETKPVESKEREVPMMIPIRECGHFATTMTTFLAPRLDNPKIMREYCLECLLLKVIEYFKIEPCGELDLEKGKVVWRK